MRYFRAGRGEQGNRVRRPGIRVANEAGLQNIITEAQVLKCLSLRVCVRVCVRSIRGSRSPLVLLTQQDLYDSLKSIYRILSFF